MKNKAKNILKSSKILYSLFEDIYYYIRGLYFAFFTFIFSIFKIDRNKMMVVSYYGKGFGDNGKYIINEILNKNNKNIKIFWALKNLNDNSLPDDVIPVKFNSIKFLYHLTTAKIWLNNTRFLNGIRKRKKQIYIQIWHGNLALKKIEFDSTLPKNYTRIMKEDNKKIDLMISNSKFCTDMYRNSFKYNGEICEFGTPRNDVFINNSDIKLAQKKVFQEYKIPNNSKILLYAPTFRDNYSKNPYNIDFNSIIKSLEEKTKNKWIIIVRFHPLVINGERFIKYEKYINATHYPDMQELINACDLLITDYSSTMFDSMIASKPVVLYANDIEKYKDERGYYFDLEKLPFPLAQNNHELTKVFNNMELKQIVKGYNKFKDSLKLVEDGNASKKVAEKIEKLMRE